jgi:mono/diheme cytochrome c family protein
MTTTFSLPRALLTVAVTAALCLAPVASGSLTSAIAQDAAASSSEPAPSAEPAAPTDEQIKAGLHVWKDRGGCFNCHGDFGQGGEGGHFPAGPSLRKTALDLETIHLVISCGLPGTKMPFNLEGAYKTEDCYGTVGEEPPAEVSPGAALSKQEIDDLVAYLGARVVGQRRITKDQCVEYYDDPNAPACAAYR